MESAVYSPSDHSPVTPSEEVLKALVDSLPTPIALFDVNGRLWVMNNALANDTHLYEQLLIYRVRPVHLSSPDIGKISFSVDRPQANLAINKPIPVDLLPVIGQSIPCQLIANLWPNVHWLTINRSSVIPESQKNHGQLELLQSVLDCIPVRLFWKDKDSRYLGGNSIFAQDCGMTSGEDLIGKDDFEFFPADEAKNYRADDLAVMTSGISKINIEECQTRPDGSFTWLQTNKVPIRNAQKEIVGVMGSYADITERKNYQAMIEHQARFDHLTGLSNRLALSETIEEFASGQQVNNGGGLLFLDLDYFKSVNDTLGHHVGDKLLKQVAERINEVAQNQALVCRLGGDEFAVLVVFPIIISPQVALEQFLESINKRHTLTR